MGTAWTIAKKDLALRLRDRSVIVTAVIAPLTLAFIFNLVFGGSVAGVGERIQFDYGVVDLDAGAVGGAFTTTLDAIRDDGLITVTDYPDEPSARAAVEDEEVAALFVLPADLSANISSGLPAGVEVVANVDSPTAAGVAESIAEQFATGLRSATIAAVTAFETGAITEAELASTAQAAATTPPVVNIGEVAAEVRQLDAATYFVAGLSIFFMFFIAGLGVTSMLEERRDGTLARLVAAPIGRGSIVAGKSLTSVLIGLAAMAVLVVASRFLMGASWGPPLGVALLVGAGVLAVVAMMSLVGGLAKTAEQAGNLQSIVAVTLGMLGGTFVPINDANSLVGKLSFATPNAWFLRGLGDMTGGSVVAALPAVGVLLVIAVAFAIGATFIVRRVVAP